jgi:hypothetical protein
MSIYQTYTPPSSDGGGFLKIKDGETVIMRIAGEPVIFDSDYQGKVSTRYGWVIYNLSADMAQIFTQSATFFKQIAAYDSDEDYGDIKGYNIKVTRQGEGTDTKYNIVPSPKKSELTKEQLDEVAKIDIVKAISAAPSVHNVYWLAEFAAGTFKPTPLEVKKAFPNVDESSDEPIDVSEIPFN